MSEKIVATYDYMDEQNRLLFQVVRYEPKNFRQRHPDGKGGWIWNLDGVRRVPYRLPELLASSMTDWVYIVEGEKDADNLIARNFIATTNSGGARKWLNDYNQYFKGRLVAILPDNDTPGRDHARIIAESLHGTAGVVKIVELTGLSPKGDVSDWFDSGGPGRIKELIRLTDEAKPFVPSAEDESKSEPADEPIDVSQFKPMTTKELSQVLGLTIKADETNKILVFLCQLSAYTASSQFNISFNAPSSTGKSFIPLEVAKLFPAKDVEQIGYCSPTSFFHDVGKWDANTKTIVVDLSRRILIFLDQPHTLLLQHLRPLLSHDQPEIVIKITDKSQKYGLKTKNVLLKGFPSVIFCTAGLKVDEQESTRFLLLSPETSQEKIREAVLGKIARESDAKEYKRWLDSQPERQLLQNRIRAIKQEHIEDAAIPKQEQIIRRVLVGNRILKPRDTRDVGRILSIIKGLALLNCWFRQRKGAVILADETDIAAGFDLWESIAESQELGLPPYLYLLHQEIIVPAYEEKNGGRNKIIEDVTGSVGLTRQEICRRHLQTYGRLLADWQLRREMLPMLESAGLVRLESDPTDKRRTLVYPTTHFPISPGQNPNFQAKNNGNAEREIGNSTVG